jgi:signal transduction histidine kinase
MGPLTRGRALSCVAVAAWALALAGYGYTIATHLRLDALGRHDLGVDPAEAVVYGAAVLSAATVGAVVAVRQGRHPVGWLFLALGVALAVGAAGDAYAQDHAVVHHGAGPLPGLALVAGQASFIAWFGLLAVIVHTPTGRPVSHRWGAAMLITSAAAVLGLAAKALQDTRFDPPYSTISNPWAQGRIAGLVDVVVAAIMATVVGLVVSAASLAVRFRRADDDVRRQLRWLAAIVVATPVLAVASFVAAWQDLPVLRTVATGGFVALIPLAAGLSVMRFRLYDVDRILGRAATYMLSSVALAAVYSVIVATVGRVVGGIVDDEVVPAVLATVATVSAAAPIHRELQEVIDRRFNRRRHEAHRLVREHLRMPVPSVSLERLLASALRDPTLDVAYWLPTRHQWVTAAGKPATVELDDVTIAREQLPVARLRIDPSVDVGLARSVAEEASAELDNLRLRAEIALQLEEVRDSRARIVAAEAAERHRIERNLHDGAQQRLLALAMQLRAGQVRLGQNGSRAASDELLEGAIDELGVAIRELRDLANGLRPSVLADGGLAVALDDLAGRVPLDVALDAPDDRFMPAVEEVLWFVACEAVANAVKHSGARRLWLSLSTEPSGLRLVCRDDGAGGARADGRGLRGIADRAEALGGTLRVQSPAGAGTTIEVVMPCGS